MNTYFEHTNGGHILLVDLNAVSEVSASPIGDGAMAIQYSMHGRGGANYLGSLTPERAAEFITKWKAIRTNPTLTDEWLHGKLIE